jgi:hypothetical protein
MGTWRAEFHPELELAGPVVRKGSHGEDGYSGFTMRDLETERLRAGCGAEPRHG